jgi:hypothetical protein
VPDGTRPFLFAPACGKLAGETLIGDSQMKRYGALAALLACASLVAACGREDDGSPTSAENESLNNISAELDVDASADSLVVDDPALGNGEAGAQTGELPVDGGETNVAAANGM